MEFDIHAVLKKYWGFDEFRSLQEDIIRSALSGNDTLALLPTGGGKSICFQVPALAKDGICIVVSPLIALMNDQVQNLKKKGISAVAITSSLSHREIDIAFDNCVYGDVKFLYLSPERLKSDLARERIKKMKVNLVAIDEAHCISQWGYDFRPPYMEIKSIRELHPKVPFLALTATATPKVVEDIQVQLGFKKKLIFQKSFLRDNISYSVLYEEDKWNRMLKIIRNVGGSGIVYLRSRKKTEQLAASLLKARISADYYHAGLSSVLRDKKQKDWIENKTQVIVSTNAFGMGIDKPDVRFVIHTELSDSLEAYFQEAGRAGRDEKKAYAVLLYQKVDGLELKSKTTENYPSFEQVKSVYEALGNYFQLAVGSGKELTFPFNAIAFYERYNYKPAMAYQALKLIEREGYIFFDESPTSVSKLMFKVGNTELYDFQVRNATLDPFIKLILRSYSGAFDEYVRINESELAKRANLSFDKVTKMLEALKKSDIIDYIPKSKDTSITFITERLSSSNFIFSKKDYDFRKNNLFDKIEAMIKYAETSNICRSRQLLAYFGETNSEPCGLCDVCLGKNEKNSISQEDYENILSKITPILKQKPATTEELWQLTRLNKESLLKTINKALENGVLVLNNAGQLIIQ